MEKVLIDVAEMKAFLIERKKKSLLHESQSTGQIKAIMTAHIQWIDSLLIYFSSKREKEDMDKLELHLEEATPIEDSEMGHLAQELVKLVPHVKEGHKHKIAGVVGKQAETIYSKMWTLREKGILPKHIVPMQQKNKDTKQMELYIAYKTPEQLAKIRSKVK